MHRAVPALLALAPLLAGCTGEAPSGDDVQPAGLGAAAAGSGTPAGPLGTAAAQGGEGAGTPATAWVREFWGQDTRKTLAQGTDDLAVHVAMPQGGCINCWGAFFPPAEGMFVAPGAERVEVTATWTPPPTAPTMRVEMFYMTAGPAAEPTMVPLESGEAVVLPVAVEQADAPLAPRSQWWFWLRALVEPTGVVPPTPVELTAVVHRGQGELPLYPEAPDPWAAGDVRELLAPQTADQDIIVTPDGWVCNPCSNGWDATGIVPEGARLVTVTVTWDWGTPSPVMWHWNAALDNGAAMELLEDGQGTRTFTASVAPDALDSPYQHRSTWGFWFELDTGPFPAGQAQGTIGLSAAVSR